jgi:hypothetical protein
MTTASYTTAVDVTLSNPKPPFVWSRRASQKFLENQPQTQLTALH